MKASAILTLKVKPVYIGLSAICIFMAFCNTATAQERPVAIVEDISGNVVGVEPFDLLNKNREITLSADAGLIISYLDSCQRENIRGGTIVIGDVQSDIQGGEVIRRRLPCDAAALNLTPEQANQSATLVFREPPKEEGVDLFLLTREPIVVAPNIAEIKLEQLEKNITSRIVKVIDGVAELTSGNKLLDQGGLYRLTAGDKIIVFRVGKEATDNPTPLLQRTIRF